MVEFNLSKWNFRFQSTTRRQTSWFTSRFMLLSVSFGDIAVVVDLHFW